MPLTHQQKEEIIKNLKDKIVRQKMMVFVDFTGLKVRKLSELRKELKEINSLFKVSKKTLLGIVLKDFNSSLAQEVGKLKGELGVILGFGNEGDILPIKTVYNFSIKNKNLKILGGFFEEKFIDKKTVLELAKIPTKKELLAKLVGSFAAPISNFANVLQGNIKGLVCVLGAINK